jgi:hypothetical protein
MSKAINKAAKVRMMLRRNPNTKAAAVVEVLGCAMQQAHVLLNTQRKQLGIIRLKDGTYKSKERMQSSEPASAGSLDKVPSIVQEHFFTSDFPIADLVNQPAHYKVGGIETIDFIEGKNLGYNLGNAVKYISRADHKGNRLQDLQKAQWYLNREIAKSQA